MAEPKREPPMELKAKRSSAGSSSPEYDMHRQYTTYSNGAEPNYEDSELVQAPWTRRVIDSFKPDPRFQSNPLVDQDVGGHSRGWDPHAAAINTANSPLARQLKGRHLQMIAIGGSIGMFSHMQIIDGVLIDVLMM